MKSKSAAARSRELGSIFVRFMGYAKSEEARELCRKRPADFTRVRKFPFHDVLLFLIFRHERCIPDEISRYYSSIGKPSSRISRQAAFKAIKKLNPRIFPALLRKLSELFYASGLVKDYKGYVLWAEDGTTLNFYKSGESMENYGFASNHNTRSEKQAKKATSRSSALFDVTNGLVVDFKMGRYEDSELPMAIEKLEESAGLLRGRKAIYLADRNYGSVELFALLELRGLKYCVRGKSNFFKRYISRMEEADGWICVELDDAWRRRLKYAASRARFEEDPRIWIRVVKTSHSHLAEGKEHREELIYFTNLGEDEFDSAEVAKLYAKRWQIESSYKTLKSDYEWERYFSLDCDCETCAIWGKLIFHNLVGIARKELDEELAAGSEGEAAYVANVKQLSRIFHDERMCRWLRSGNAKKIISVLDSIHEAKDKLKVPVRPDRHCKRWGRHVSTSRPHRFKLDGRQWPNTAYVGGAHRTVKPS